MKVIFVLEPDNRRIEKELSCVPMVGERFYLDEKESECNKVYQREFHIYKNEVILWCEEDE